MRFERGLRSLLGAGLLLLIPALSSGQAGNPDPERFADAIARFEQWDRQNAAPSDGVLFVGSSSIVRWATAERFPDLPVINRGFGGSHISDVSHYVEQTVLRYAPRVIVFYAGNNDINGGKTPTQVLGDYRAFIEAVRERTPGTQIVYVSIHPSPARWGVWPMMREANALIRAYTEQHPTLHYVDISLPMLGVDGEPLPHLFVEDRLHLSEAGYDLWTPIVARAIAEVRPGE